MKKICYSTLLVLCTILLFSHTSSATCTASFTRTATGLTVTFTSTSTSSSGSTAGLKYFWDFGDGTTSTLQNPTKQFTAQTVHTIKHAIFDSILNCTDTLTDTLTVRPTYCNAVYLYTVSGLTVSFNNYSASIPALLQTNYYWNFGDGTESTLKDPIKTYASNGLYNITLSMFDSASGCMDSYSQTININGNCKASYKLDSMIIDPSTNSTAYFHNTSLNSFGDETRLSYLWDFGDSTTSTEKNPTKVYAPNTFMRFVRLSISDSVTGCLSSIIDTIYVESSYCYAIFDYTVNGATVSFHNYSTNKNGSSIGLTYLWNFGDGTTSTQKNPTKTYLTGGSKQVSLMISDSSQSCESLVSTYVLTSAPVLCEAHFDVVADSTTPFNFFIINNSLIRPTSLFLWEFGDGTTSTLKTPTHSYANFGQYTVCLKVFDSICTSTFCKIVGMDSNGVLIGKSGAFGFTTIDQTTLSTTTGIALSEVVKGSVKIYPNPGRELVNVSFTSEISGPVQFELFDITGKVIHTTEFISKPGEHSETLNLSEYKPSIYFLKIMTNSGTQVHKIIKN